MVNPILASSWSIFTSSEDLVGVLCVCPFGINTLLLACIFLTAIKLIITKAACNDFISLLLALIGITGVKFIELLSLDLWRVLELLRWLCDEGLRCHKLRACFNFLRVLLLKCLLMRSRRQIFIWLQ